jgi:hypothetical protein
MGQPPGGKCVFNWKRVNDGCVATEHKSGRRDSQEKFSSNTQQIITESEFDFKIAGDLFS